jgi:hypothetical protein
MPARIAGVPRSEPLLLRESEEEPMEHVTKRDWNSEDAYWRGAYSGRPYYRSGRSYEDYQPAYRYGYESWSRHADRGWDEVEADLRAGWDRWEHKSKSTWEEMKDAVRDAWNRLTGSDTHARDRHVTAR